MKAYFYLVLILCFPAMLFAQEDAKSAMFIGADGCKKCHKTSKQGKQFQLWEESGHAKAFETLKSEAAQKIAAEKGLAKAAHESAECLKCHATGYDVAADLLKAKFSIEQGVQCETCHGAGSLYKAKKVMKDREASIAKGMTPIFVDDGSAEKQCLSCHNEESPTYKEFNFAEMWEKIAHPVPVKE